MGGDGDEAALLECHSDDEDEWEMPVAHEVNEQATLNARKHVLACARTHVRTRTDTHAHTHTHAP